MKSSVIEAATAASSVVAYTVGTASVQLQKTTGPAKHLGSGFLYGIPNNGTSASTAIADHFYMEMGFLGTRPVALS